MLYYFRLENQQEAAPFKKLLKAYQETLITTKLSFTLRLGFLVEIRRK
jgi:hypothetical protein